MRPVNRSFCNRFSTYDHLLGDGENSIKSRIIQHIEEVEKTFFGDNLKETATISSERISANSLSISIIYPHLDHEIFDQIYRCGGLLNFFSLLENFDTDGIMCPVEGNLWELQVNPETPWSSSSYCFKVKGKMSNISEEDMSTSGRMSLSFVLTIGTNVLYGPKDL